MVSCCIEKDGARFGEQGHMGLRYRLTHWRGFILIDWTRAS